MDTNSARENLLQPDKAIEKTHRLPSSYEKKKISPDANRFSPERPTLLRKKRNKCLIASHVCVRAYILLLTVALTILAFVRFFTLAISISEDSGAKQKTGEENRRTSLQALKYTLMIVSIVQIITSLLATYGAISTKNRSLVLCLYPNIFISLVATLILLYSFIYLDRKDLARAYYKFLAIEDDEFTNTIYFKTESKDSDTKDRYFSIWVSQTRSLLVAIHGMGIAFNIANLVIITVYVGIFSSSMDNKLVNAVYFENIIPDTVINGLSENAKPQSSPKVEIQFD